MSDMTEILKVKNQWIESEFVGGVILCDFFLMKEIGLDIVYDSDDKLVQEYIDLLRQRLETDDFNLMLMTNTEIEKCIIDKEEIYEYLNDEIYEHFKNSGKKYPLQVVGLHIDVITALVYLNEKEKVNKYLHTIKKIYKEILGEESYLFCRNWCYILNEVLLELMPMAAAAEFEQNMDLFSSVLREEEILYILCIHIGAKRTNQEQEVSYIKESIMHCETWCKDVPTEKQKDIQKLIQGMSAMYYRSIGEYDPAIRRFKKALELAEDIHYKLYLLSQIATMLYIKREWKELEGFFEHYKNLMTSLQEPDENVAELYNLYGIYYMEIGNYHEAQIQMEKAIDISSRIFGKEADAAIKFECNRLLVRYRSGEIDESSVRMQSLLNIVSKVPEQYPESLPLVFNNVVAMSFENRINSAMVLKLKAVLDSKRVKYDMASNIIFKSNLYCTMMASGDSYSEEIINELREELQNYFNKYPNTVGFYEYLKAEYCRLRQENNESLAYKILGEIECYLGKENLNIVSREYFTYFTVKLKKLVYKKDYIVARKWLLSLWDDVLRPLFVVLNNKYEENMKNLCLLMHSYISLFISLARQYSQLKITSTVLYEYVLNFKYFEDLFYCNKPKLSSALESKMWLSVKSINLSREKLIIECFNYRKYNMEDIRLIFGSTDDDLSSAAYQICFGVQLMTGILPKYNVEVVSDIPLTEFIYKVNTCLETKEITQFEREAWSKLKEFVNKKEIIYVCNDISTVQIPLAAMRINENQYWGEMYQIIYCNSGKDVKDDIEIHDFSNSIYFGMSTFDDDKEKSNQRIQKKFSDLFYTELEIEKLGDLMGGEVYLDEEISKTLFDGQRREIMHFATHTTDTGSDRSKSLIIGKYKSGQYMILSSTDISELDWTNVKLVVLVACKTGEEKVGNFGRHSLSQAARKAGAQFSISTTVEVEDGTNAFFMVCFYKNLLKYRKISRAFFETQKIMCAIKKREILGDSDYLDIGMDYYLENYEEESIPFQLLGDWSVYILQMN